MHLQTPLQRCEYKQSIADPLSPLIATFSQQCQEKKGKYSQAFPISLEHPPNMLHKFSVLGMELSKSSVTNVVSGSLPMDFLTMKQHTLEDNI